MSLAKDLAVVQNGTIDGIKTLSNLVSEISATLSEEQQKEYNLLKSALDNESGKLEKLELTTAIVAPMKSGKSTIVNAIAGQELLPTRNAAMTTLPTEVVLTANDVPARLILSDQLIAAYREIAGAIKARIKNDPGERLKVLDPAPHLDKTMEFITAGNSESLIAGEVTGAADIVDALLLLNEIIRIGVYLGISIQSMNDLDALPRIEASYREGITNQWKTGKLVIIDTPGPNEAGQDHLGPIVQKQLWRCSVVMVVLDYTHLNDQAEEDVRKEVEKIIALRGKENLFVLVNKIDHRGKRNDMTVSDVKRYVKNLFGFENNYEDRLFEISANRAFAASSCLFGIEKNSLNKESIAGLLQIVEPLNWEKKAENISEQELKENIAMVWNASNFTPFLEKAIARLLADAAPMTIHSALNQCFAIINKLYNDAALRKSGVDKEMDEINAEIRALSADLASILKKRAELTIIEKIKGTIISNLSLSRRAIDMSLPEQVAKNFNGEKTLSFSSETEAERFITKLKEETASVLKNRMKGYEDAVTKILVEGQSSIIESLEKDIEPILEQVKLRMEKAFDVKISFEKPGGRKLLFQGKELDALSVNKKIYQWTEQVARYRYVPTQFSKVKGWLNKYFKTDFITEKKELDGFDAVQRESINYDVHLSDLKNAFSGSIQANIKTAEEFTDVFVTNHIDKEVTDYFKEVDDYLQSYRNTLEQMKNDKKLSKDEKDILRKQLDSISKRSLREKERLQAIGDQLKQLFRAEK
ncbi:MAG: dynamin family protein [Bacteroidetes bacterium]|nr:dynamin family protein [Bacteroidota bacterium]